MQREHVIGLPLAHRQNPKEPVIDRLSVAAASASGEVAEVSGYGRDQGTAFRGEVEMAYAEGSINRLLVDEYTRLQPRPILQTRDGLNGSIRSIETLSRDESHTRRVAEAEGNSRTELQDSKLGLARSI